MVCAYYTGISQTGNINVQPMYLYNYVMVYAYYTGISQTGNRVFLTIKAKAK